jgi:hypothetical protein
MLEETKSLMERGGQHHNCFFPLVVHHPPLQPPLKHNLPLRSLLYMQRNKQLPSFKQIQAGHIQVLLSKHMLVLIVGVL